MLEAYPSTSLRVAVVWINILPTDDSQSAAWASSLFDDPRVAQFHDPAKLAGNHFARGLLTRPPAWDIYLAYDRDARWGDPSPRPAHWMHQLSGEQADPERYRTGIDLARSLHAALGELGMAAESPAPSPEELALARRQAGDQLVALRGAEAAHERCLRCSERAGLGTCSAAGWRSLVAMRSSSAPDRIEMRAGPGEASGRTGEITLEVAGLLCPDCMPIAAAALFGLPDVLGVAVDLDRTLMTAWPVPGAILDPRALVETLNEQGFNACRAGEPPAETSGNPEVNGDGR